MVYKRFEVRNGKTFGPYYYESFRKDGSVHKVYIGGEKEYQAWKKEKARSERKGFGAVIRGAYEKSCSTLGFVKNKKFSFIVLFGLLVLFGGLFVATNYDSMHRNLAGFVVFGNGTEGVVESFLGDVTLEIKEPVESLGVVLSKNKNERMDFDLGSGKLRLYFDLLNYSEFVRDVAEIVALGNVSEVVFENVTEVLEVPIVENITDEINESENATVIPVVENVTEGTTEMGEVLDNVTDVEDEGDAGVGGDESEDENATREPEVEGGAAVDESTTDETVVVEEVALEEVPVEEVVVEEVTSEEVAEVGITANVIRGFFSFVGRVIGIDLNESIGNESVGGEVETVIVDLLEVQERAGVLDESELDVISDNVVVVAEDFEIEVTQNITDDTKREVLEEYGEEPDYKWGYNVRLNDLKFMAKIEVTAEEGISVYDANTLQIGRNLLSFSDLVAEGYSIRFESPILEIENGSLLVDVPIDSVPEVVGGDELSNDTEVVINDTDDANITDEIVSNVTEGDILTDGGNLTDEEKQKKEKEKKEKEEKEKAEKEKKEKEEKEQKEDEEKSVGLLGGVTGNAIFTILGFVVANESALEIEDVLYTNSVTLYIERDFSQTNYSVGDLITLDPTLIIIPITDAEHLDVNRSFISNIYNETVAQDDVWSEVIMNLEFARVTFESALDSSKDVTVFARVKDKCSGGEVNSSVVVGGIEVSCEIYNKKKRIDEIRELLG